MFVSGCLVLLWAPFRESRALDVASPDDDVYYYNVVAKGEGTVLGFRVFRPSAARAIYMQDRKCTAEVAANRAPTTAQERGRESALFKDISRLGYRALTTAQDISRLGRGATCAFPLRKSGFY